MLEPVVVTDHVQQRGEAAVVEEAALLRGALSQTAERRGPVAPIGRAIGLERIDSDLGGRVHIPTRLGVERRDVGGGATRAAHEKASDPRPRPPIARNRPPLSPPLRQLIIIKGPAPPGVEILPLASLPLAKA